MSITKRTEPTSLDKHALSVVPVVLGGPSLRRRAAEPRRPLLRRSTPEGRPSIRPSDRDRLSTPR